MQVGTRSNPTRRLGVALVAAALVATALADTAVAGSAPRADFSFDLSTRAPGARSAIHLQILYKGSTPDAKPSPIRRITILAPTGMRFDSRALPRCDASDDELRAEGDAACPAASALGGGVLTGMTGFGAPLDPVATDVTIYNTAAGNVELVKEQSSGRPLATDRFKITGRTWSAQPPSTPGGPPDGETAVRRIDFHYAPKAAWAVAPPKCGRHRRWRSTGIFTYADGVTATVHDDTPCRRPPRRRGLAPG
jgi:hypothetical protein